MKQLIEQQMTLEKQLRSMKPLFQNILMEF